MVLPSWAVQQPVHQVVMLPSLAVEIAPVGTLKRPAHHQWCARAPCVINMRRSQGHIQAVPRSVMIVGMTVWCGDPAVSSLSTKE
jgi:hypothetical protein